MEEEDLFRDRARLRRAQMEKRLDLLVASSSLSSSNGGSVPLLAIDRQVDASGNTMLHYCGWRRDAVEGEFRTFFPVFSSFSAARRLVEVVPIASRNVHGETCLVVSKDFFFFRVSSLHFLFKHIACRNGNAAVLVELLTGAQITLKSDQMSQLLNTREWRMVNNKKICFSVLRKPANVHCVAFCRSCFFHGLRGDSVVKRSGSFLARCWRCFGRFASFTCGLVCSFQLSIALAVLAANNGQDALLALLSREWYALEVWRPALHSKFPSTFKREVWFLLLSLKRVHAIYKYRDCRWLIIIQLARLYKNQRLRRGLLNSRDRTF